jgi:hypothetical protein
MYWRVINSKEYLYQYARTVSGQQVKSLGPKTSDAEASYQEFKQVKQDLEERREAIEKRLKQLAPVWRALRLPAVDATAGKILRAFDQVNLVGKSLLVVGTYALKAYEVVAIATFAAGMDATEDLDFTLFADETTADPDLPRRLLLTLKQVDSSFVVATGSPKTVVNKHGYRVDLLTNKAAAKPMSSARPWKPEALDGQEWLLLGNPVNVVLIDFEGVPVAVSAPDPRYFALHKLWLSKRPGRAPVKAAKDRSQGDALLKAIKEHMGHYPIDEKFIESLPASLRAQLPGTYA